jgi:hypothetical protein
MYLKGVTAQTDKRRQTNTPAHTHTHTRTDEDRQTEGHQ